MKTSTLTKKLALLLCAIFLAQGAFVAVQAQGSPQPINLATWTLSGMSGGGVSPFAPTTSADGIIVGGLTRGGSTTGLIASGSPAGSAWGGVITPANNAGGGSMATAIANGSFVTFTVQAEVNNRVSLTQIGAYNVRRSAGGPQQGQWQYSLNGTDFFDIGSPITWGGTTSDAGNVQPAIDLSSINALQDVGNEVTITIRIVLWNNGNNGTFWLNGHSNGGSMNFTINGVVTFPQGHIDLPTFSHQTGNIFEPSINVTISPAVTNGGDEILFSTDPNAPRWEFTPYVSAIAISETTILRAIAVSGNDTSDIATATYTFPINVPDIATFFAQSALPQNDGAIFRIESDLIFVWSSARNVWLREASGSGLYVFDWGVANAVLSGLSPGNIITSGLIGTRGEFGGQSQFIPVQGHPTLQTETGSPDVLPIVISMEDLLGNFDEYLGSFVRLEGVTFQSTTTFGTAIWNRTIEQGSSEMIFRNNWGGIDGTTVTAGVLYDITGFVRYNNSTGQGRQIGPRFSADITPTPIITVNHLSHGFGNEEVGETTAPFEFNVSQVGLTSDISWQLNDTSAGGVFNVTEYTNWTDADGGTLLVTFTPNGEYTFRATITLIGPGAQSIDTVVINLTGTGVAVGTPILQFADDTPLNFGRKLVGETSQSQTTSVVSGENLTENISFFFNTTGSAAGTNFTIVAPIAPNFDAAAGGFFTITFTPTQTGVVYDTLVVRSVADGVSDTLIMFGEGVAPMTVPIATAATNVGPISFTANWNSVAGADSFRLYVVDAASTPVTGSPFTNITGTSFNVTGLTPDTEYTYTVVAINDVETTAASNQILVATLEPEVFSLITGMGEFGPGLFVIVNLDSDFAMSTHNTGTGPLGFARAAVTSTNDTIINPAENLIWEIQRVGDVYTIRTHTPPAAGQNFINWATVNDLSLTETAGDSAHFEVSYNNGFEFFLPAEVTNPAGTARRRLAYRSALGVAGGGPRFGLHSTVFNADNQRIALFRLGGAFVPPVADPTFDPPAGAFFAEQNVTISTVTENARVYWTNNPTATIDEFTLFTTAVPVSTTTTLRAFAVSQDNADTSQIVSATYIFPVDVANIEEFLALEEGAIARITEELTVVFQFTRNLFVQDASGWLLIDWQNPLNQYIDGDRITGVVGTRGVFGGHPQLVVIPNVWLPKGVAGGPAVAAVVEAKDITEDDMNRYIAIEGAVMAAAVTFNNTAIDGQIVVGNPTMTIRDHWGLISGTFTEGAVVNLKGIVRPFEGTRRIHLLQIEAVPTPTITASPNPIAFGTQNIGTTSSAHTLTVTGAALTQNITVAISGSDAAAFSAGVTSLPTAGGTLNITFAPTAARAYSATLTLSSAGAENVVVQLSGTGVVANSICPREELENSVVLFPNPVQDELFIETTETISAVRIYNLSGQLVVQQHGNVNSVDVSALPQGTYIVRIVFDSGIILSRTIVK
ncbi:MAG: chitobiase/beta-hexosaminidase C-terminal domain-containing protein [Bacteroidales bacterium]|nr:chitobiase/beta-hexosaminidase C-terminal domain-containing protein [Bacteroidales bacterium]